MQVQISLKSLVFFGTIFQENKNKQKKVAVHGQDFKKLSYWAPFEELFIK